MNIEWRSMTGLGPQAWDHDYQSLVIPSMNHHRNSNYESTIHGKQARDPPLHNLEKSSVAPSAQEIAVTQGGPDITDECTIGGDGSSGGCAGPAVDSLDRACKERPVAMTRQMLAVIHPVSEYRHMLFTRELWRFWLRNTLHTQRCAACEIVLLCVLSPFCVAGTLFTLCADAFGFTMPG